jgi:hypothetical protein
MDVQDGRRLDAPTLAEREVVSFVRRRYEKLKGTDRGEEYFALLYQLVEHDESRAFAVDVIQRLEDGDERAADFVIKAQEADPDDVMLTVIVALTRKRWRRRRAMAKGYASYNPTPKGERQPTRRPSPRVRVPQTRPRERRPGSARRTRTSFARQSAGDSSPPGEPPPPRKAVYGFGCEARERWGLS